MRVAAIGLKKPERGLIIPMYMYKCTVRIQVCAYAIQGPKGRALLGDRSRGSSQGPSRGPSKEP